MNRCKSNIKGELELRRTQLWHVLPSYAHTFRMQYESVLLGHKSMSLEGVSERHSSGWFALKSNGFVRKPIVAAVEKNVEDVEDLVLTDDPEYDMTQQWWQEEGPLISPDDEFINIIDIRSSVTRNGSWCSSGSIEHRDQMVFASRFPNCIGHIFIIDTPGGSAYSKNDYQQGIAAARAAGQPVLSWIDGMCASAGVAASVQTDEIYVQHPNCEYGCIGTMAAFYTMADGTKDEDGYVYHELYDPESYEKNLEYRELANNDNPDPLLADLAQDGADFRALVKACRPGVKDDMLHGKMFRASDVMGVFIDGVKSFEQVVERVIELNGGAELIQHVALVEEPEPEPEPKPEDAETSEETQTQTNINNEMKQYENINAALEVEALAVTADGSFYCNSPLADKLEAKLAEANQNAELLAANNETVATLNAKVAELKAENENANAQIASLNEEKETLNSQIASLNEEKETLNAQIASLNEEKETLNAQIAEKDKEIEELSTAAQNAPVPAPAETQEPEQKEDNRSLVQTIYGENMTPAEKAAAKEARMAYLNSLRK